MTDMHKIILENYGDKPWEPYNVKDDYKEFKDFTYDVKMSLKDISEDMLDITTSLLKDMRKKYVNE